MVGISPNCSQLELGIPYSQTNPFSACLLGSRICFFFKMFAGVSWSSHSKSCFICLLWEHTCICTIYTPGNKYKCQNDLGSMREVFVNVKNRSAHTRLKDTKSFFLIRNDSQSFHVQISQSWRALFFPHKLCGWPMVCRTWSADIRKTLAGYHRNVQFIPKIHQNQAAGLAILMRLMIHSRYTLQVVNKY